MIFKDMTELLHDDCINDVSIEHFEITQKDLRAIFQGIPLGKYVRLMRRNELLMSNTPMEERTNIEFCQKAYGDVLIGGLGIGMIIAAIQDNPVVSSITVIEIDQDVIDLIKNQNILNDKVHIICDNVFTWKPNKSTKYDCIYMDIWSYINNEIYHNEMKPLKRKYGHYLKPLSESPNRFNLCWAERNAKHGIRLY